MVGIMSFTAFIVGVAMANQPRAKKLRKTANKWRTVSAGHNYTHLNRDRRFK